MAQEKEWLEGCLKGNRRAQRSLYDAYKVPMFRLCLRYARDHAEAEDMLQEGFIRVFRDLTQYRGDGPLGGWIRKAMIHAALQYLRRERKFQVTDDLETIAETHEQTEHIFDQLDAKVLTRMIQQLPPGYRAVFNLYVVEGFTHPEIAGQLDISVGASKSQLFKAKAMLKSLVEKTMAV